VDKEGERKIKRKAVLSLVSVVLFLVSVFPMSTFAGKAHSHLRSESSAAQSTVDPTDWWPMFHHDLSHAGYSTSTAPRTNQTLWTYATGGAVETSPAVVDDMVYIGSDDEEVYAMNATTGALVWNYTTSGMVLSSPAVADGKVFVDSQFYQPGPSLGGGGFIMGKVYALNATTGALIWTNPPTLTALYSSPAVAAGIVYVAQGSDVFALNDSTGALVWNYFTGNLIESSPAVADGILYVGSEGKSVFALNASTGTYVWSYATGDKIDSSPTVVDGRVFVGSLDGKTYSLNATNGALMWECATDSVPSYYLLVGASSPAVVDGIVYVSSTFNQRAYALDASTGAVLWNSTIGGYVFSSPAVVGGMVFFGSDDSKLYALDACTGALVWSYTTGGTVFSSPAVADGVLYVGSDDGNVYAFGPGVNVHELAVTSVTADKTVVGQGYSVNIAVIAMDFNETSETLNVTIYANATSIASQNVTLSTGSFALATFSWNTSGFAIGNYTIRAYAWLVPDETNSAENSLTSGIFYVGIPGDLNGDGVVNILDTITLGKAFDATPISSNRNPNADINGDNVVNILDAIILANHFLQHYP
jgi:outer membrane protein assembly factor BamB